MLILTRRPGETIVIGDDVKVTILGVNKLQVKIGITAPKTTSVNRQEIQERIDNASKEEESEYNARYRWKFQTTYPKIR